MLFVKGYEKREKILLRNDKGEVSLQNRQNTGGNFPFGGSKALISCLLSFAEENSSIDTYGNIENDIENIFIYVYIDMA